MSDNQDQIDYWDGEAGDKWVAHAERLDAMLAPFADLILEKADIRFDDHVLDVGCGAGALSLESAEKADVLGVDVSSALLELARQRTGDLNATFEQGDAATHDYDSHFDVVISRFGVMFFNDPVTAFSHIRSATARGGKLCFTCWQAPEKNAWAMTPLMVAMPFLKEAPQRPDPRSPGPFAFADLDYINEILTGAGWSDIKIEPYETDMIMPGRAPADSAAFMLKMGPMGRILAEQELDLDPVAQALTDHFEKVRRAKGQVALGSAIWLVTARA